MRATLCRYARRSAADLHEKTFSKYPFVSIKTGRAFKLMLNNVWFAQLQMDNDSLPRFAPYPNKMSHTIVFPGLSICWKG